jgi:hypothetical protein
VIRDYQDVSARRLLSIEQKAQKIDDRHGHFTPTVPSSRVVLGRPSLSPNSKLKNFRILQLTPAFWSQRAHVNQTKM